MVDLTKVTGTSLTESTHCQGLVLITKIQEHPIAQRKQDQLIRLQRGSTTTGTVPSGIYRCDVETVAANNTVREMVYVGVYGSGGT